MSPVSSVLLALAASLAVVNAFSPLVSPRVASRGQVTMMAAPKPKLKYVDAIKTSDLPSPGNAVSCVAGGLDVCIAVATDGLVYALGNKVPPTGTPLAGGKVSKDTIKDPQYGTEYDLNSGAAVKWLPGPIGALLKVVFQEPASLPTYRVKKGGSTIQVEVDVNYKLAYESNYWKGILDAQGKTEGGYY